MKMYQIFSAMLLSFCIMNMMLCTSSSASEGFLWEHQQVYETKSSDNQLHYFSMKIDSKGYPQICFAEKIPPSIQEKTARYCLNYAYWNESGWQSFLMTFDRSFGQYCSLAIDNNDNPHIVNYLQTVEYSNLEYVFWNGTTWVFTTADAGGDVGQYCSIAVDTKGYAHISYYNNAGSYGLKYALIRGPGQTWDIETIDPGIFVGLGTSIALDSKDYPHISFYDVYHRDNSLRYASYNGQRWNFETVDYGGQKIGEGNSLAIDTNDHPHISYHSEETNAVKYAYKENDEWIIETVDTGEFSPFTSLALDTSNTPHITYVDFTDGNTVKYAHKVGGSWEIQDVATGSRATIALSTENTPHILYGDNNGLFLATPLMRISNPSSNQILHQGETYDIRWNLYQTKEYNSNLGPYVKIELFNQGQLRSVLSTNTTNDGTYTGKISNDLEPGSYQLKISDVSDDTRSVYITVVIQQQSFQELLVGIVLLVAIIISLILLRIYLKKRTQRQTKKKKKE